MNFGNARAIISSDNALIGKMVPRVRFKFMF